MDFFNKRQMVFHNQVVKHFDVLRFVVATQNFVVVENFHFFGCGPGHKIRFL